MLWGCVVPRVTKFPGQAAAAQALYEGFVDHATLCSIATIYGCDGKWDKEALR